MFLGQCQGLTWLLAVGQGPRARVVAGVREKDALGYGDGNFQNWFSLGFLQPWHRGRRELGGVRLQQQLLGDLVGVSARADRRSLETLLIVGKRLQNSAKRKRSGIFREKV